MDKREINEECGIIGVYQIQNASSLAYYGLHSLQHRGQESCGIVSKDVKDFYKLKGPGLVTEVFKEEFLKSLRGDSAIGHVRYSGNGNRDLEDIQPLFFHHSLGDFSLAYNGQIVNSNRIRGFLEKQGSIFQSNSDCEIMAHLIKREPHKDRISVILNALTILEGAFSFVIMTKDTLYAMRDKNGLKPLVIGTLQDGYVISSESCALDIIGASFLRDVHPGELIVIKNHELKSYFYTKSQKNCICSMEYIYFARPDSSIDGVNVHTSRKNAGKILFDEAPIKADVVIGVPDSSISAAIGYSERSKIPYEMGLIKNKYIGRTFIQPTQELRDKGVKMKLSAVSSLIKDKIVVLVDDSIVRGTTSKRIVKMLKEAGAREVHVRISSPAMKYVCHYGVDTSTTEELISANYNPEEICKIIQADSLYFLSEEGLRKSIGIESCCMGCFNQKYPTNLYLERGEEHE